MVRAAFRSSVLLPAGVLLAVPPVHAQDVEFRRPAEWRVRADVGHADVDQGLYFVEMPPGWHVTTGPGVVLWHPARTAEGAFRVEMEVFLFDPERQHPYRDEGEQQAQQNGRDPRQRDDGRKHDIGRETGSHPGGFGFFVGGRSLEGPDQIWVGFLMRDGGEVLVTLRRGARTETLHGWSPHPSVLSYVDRPAEASTARNVLVMDAREDDVRFVVNDREVLSMDRKALPPLDGVVGLRVGEGVNLHVSRLDVLPGG